MRDSLEAAGCLRRGRDDRLWVFSEGVYVPEGERFIEEEVAKRLGSDFSRQRVAEVRALCKALAQPLVDLPNGMMNLRNGVLVWRTENLLEHAPSVAGTVQIPVRWNPDATCPGVMQFLGEVVPVDAVPLVGEMVGYSLFSDQPLRRAFLLYGPGSNGKSTLLALVRALLGDHNVSSRSIQDLGDNRFAAADLHGKLANICGDLDTRALERSGIFKQLTGGEDFLHAERKYGHSFQFKPSATLWFSANEAPRTHDESDAFFDRWVVLPMERRFPGAQADPNLLARLTSPSELEGLLRWAVESLRTLMARGHFAPPPSVVAAGASYEQRAASVSGFLAEECKFDPGGKVTRALLWTAYERWCRSNHLRPLSTQQFTKKIRQHDGVTEGKVGQGSERGWVGVCLASQAELGLGA
jgi:putative DNA primase/helicase